MAQVFSCEFREVSKNIFFYKTPPVAASVTQNTKKMKTRELKERKFEKKRGKQGELFYIVLFAFMSTVEVGKLQKLSEMFVFGIPFICYV